MGFGDVTTMSHTCEKSIPEGHLGLELLNKMHEFPDILRAPRPISEHIREPS